MTTKHTCNGGNGPYFGKKTAGCPRCDELIAGARPVKWSRQDQEQRDREYIRRHFADTNHGKPGHKCYPVCTLGD